MQPWTKILPMFVFVWLVRRFSAGRKTFMFEGSEWYSSGDGVLIRKENYGKVCPHCWKRSDEKVENAE